MTVPGESRGRWKYMIVLGAAIVNFWNTGTAKSFGVVVPDLIHDFDTGVSILGFGIGMCHGVAVGLTFVTRPLLTMVTCRVLTMIGGLVACLGFCFCSLSGSAIPFVSGIAVAGFGYSFMIISNIVIVKDYFPHSYAVAVSFSFSGGALGMMLIPVITERLANIYGWRGALLLIAALNFHTVLAGALFRPLSSNRRQHSSSRTHDGDPGVGDLDETSDCAKEERDLASSTNSISDFKNGLRGAYAPANASEEDRKENRETQSRTHSSHEYVHLSKFKTTTNDSRKNCEESLDTSESDDDISENDGLISRERQRTQNDSESESEFLLDPEQPNRTTNDRSRMKSATDIFDFRLMYDFPAINLVMIGGLMAGATTTGWVAFLVPYGQEKGYLMSKAVLLATVGGFGNITGRFSIGYMTSQRITARAMFVACNLICGVAFCLNHVTSTFWGLSILAMVNGLTLGAMLVLICLMVEELVDDSRFASGVALAYFFLGFGEIVGGLFSGWLHDVSHTYDTAFIALGSLNFLGALLTVMTLFSCSRCQLLNRNS